MAKVSEIANILIEKRELSVKTGSQKLHDSLRTRLVKFYSRHKKLLDSIGVDDGSLSLSVSASYISTTGISTFWIRKAQKAIGEEKLEFEIVENSASG